MGSPSLDSYKHNCNKPCSKKAAYGPVDVEGNAMVGYSRIYCKGWSCPICGPKKAAELSQQIAKKAIEHMLFRFLTLTLDPSVTPNREHIGYIRDVWRKFRVYLKREFGKSITFISVLELSQSGYPHLHVLVDRYISQAWISENWSKLGGGKIVFIERVKDLRKIGWYLGKYLTKEMILSAPNGTRRFSCSRNVKLREPKEASGWKLAKFSIDTLYRAAKHKVVTVEKDEKENVKSFVVENEIEDVSPVSYSERSGEFCMAEEEV